MPAQVPGEFHTKKIETVVMSCVPYLQGDKNGVANTAGPDCDLCMQRDGMPEGQGNLIPLYFFSCLARANLGRMINEPLKSRSCVQSSPMP